MNEEAKGRDTGWAIADGETKPIREVLAERKRNHNAQDKALREAAYRERAWQQALLLSCICCAPLVKYETVSGHDEWCVSHRMWMSSEVQKKLDAERARGQT